MINWPATKAKRVLAALERTGWKVKRQRGSNRLLVQPGRPDYGFFFHDQHEIGLRMMARIAKHKGLKPSDL
ncbi:MAG: type II toxin-antitoxin system HicA family toxin [Acidobacteria bacterium]|nr:type II toxin-antitoxin system HicA family toxin [Acidobacteriota bacterium]